MKALILLLISVSPLCEAQTWSAEWVSQEIYRKAAEKNSFPDELASVPPLRWACEIEQENRRPPKSCFKLLQVLENISGESRFLDRQRLNHLRSSALREAEIETYKKKRAESGTSDE